MRNGQMQEVDAMDVGTANGETRLPASVMQRLFASRS